MNRLNLDQIKQIATSVCARRPTTVPDWLWELPFAHEPYYAFLHALAKELQPELIVELGTDQGNSAAFLATSASGKVVSVDFQEASSLRLRALAQQRGLTNVVDLCGNTLADETVSAIADMGRIGLLYIDSNHTYEQVSAERALYHPLMAAGGVVVYDDVRFSEDMGRFWDGLDDVKIELPELHWTSFGVTVLP